MNHRQGMVALSLIEVGQMCVYLICAATVSLAASTAPRATTATGDSGGQKALSSRTNSPHPSRVDDSSSRTAGQDLPPSLEAPSLTATTLYYRQRTRPHQPRHHRRNSFGKISKRTPRVTNAADLDHNTGVSVKVRKSHGDPGVLVATPETGSRSSGAAASDHDPTEIRSLCPNCGVGSREDGEENSVLPITVSEPLNREEITKIRIEAVKQQILDKLRLTRPPQVNVSNLHIPAPLYEIPDFNTQERQRDSEGRQDDAIYGSQGEDNFYGKTTKIIIQAEQDETPCLSDAPGGRCFTFHFSSENTNSNLQSAQLWVYWNGSVFSDSPSSRVNITVEGEPTFSDPGFGSIPTNDLDYLTRTGWLTFEVKHVVRRWHRHNRDAHSIRVGCNDCTGLEGRITEALAASDKAGLAPFVVMHTSRNKRTSRVRRSNDCTFVGSSQCCKESLFIRFADIGWDWIVYPEGFEANYCRGTCRLSTRLRESPVGQFHSQRRIHMVERGIEFETCCAPRVMSPLSITFYNKKGQFVKSDLPEMKVESCGCSF